ncbi:uncharacterized protein DUF3313 [Polynucleobacter brandtiae]|uniref:Uncharacterized protein DUF3313 n=2 Tax=Polynucleobacter brandtiae TaxID=1938816 RepID=A0A2M8VPP1_9BURK|nr:DUF3313 domain-containing protein [Polynucleobacter brandtiae]PJI79145.1 uncharacterized protein DUF3313 [Polynucleobacter brandtiae]
MKKKFAFLFILTALTLLGGCSTTTKLASESMPQSGFLPDYSLLTAMTTTNADVRIWRYRKADIKPGSYTAVILDPVYLNQNATQEITQDTINQAKSALQASMMEMIKNRGDIQIVTKPGPNVVRISVGITGAESTNNSLQPWNFTPVGMALTAGTYAAGVNAKTPAMLVESKLVDSATNILLGEGVVTMQGQPFRTIAGSSQSFVAMAKTIVQTSIGTYKNTSNEAVLFFLPEK